MSVPREFLEFAAMVAIVGPKNAPKGVSSCASVRKASSPRPIGALESVETIVEIRKRKDLAALELTESIN